MGGPAEKYNNQITDWGMFEGKPLGPKPSADGVYAEGSPEQKEWDRKRALQQAQIQAVLRMQLKPDAITEQILARKKKQEELLLPGAMAATMATGARGLPRSVGTLPSPLPDLLGRK